jgi:hypothetical protein
MNFLGESLQTTPESQDSNTAAWVAGSILVALAVGVYALEKKGPEPLRYRRA